MASLVLGLFHHFIICWNDDKTCLSLARLREHEDRFNVEFGFGTNYEGGDDMMLMGCDFSHSKDDS